jgi:hypothetical protein
MPWRHALADFAQKSTIRQQSPRRGAVKKPFKIDRFEPAPRAFDGCRIPPHAAAADRIAVDVQEGGYRAVARRSTR